MTKKFMNPEIPALFEKLDYTYENAFAMMSDMVRGTLTEDPKECETAIRNMFLDLFELKADEVNNKKLFRRAWKKHNEKFFEVIEDVVEDALVQGWSEDPFFMDYVEMRNLADGDRNEFYMEDEVVLAVNRISGDHHDMSVQRLGVGETVSIQTARYGAAVGTDIRLYMAGRVDFAKMIQAIYKAFDRKIKELLYSELSNVGSKLPVNSVFNKAFAFTSANKGTLDQLIEDVASANGNSDVVIVGVSTAVKKLEALDDVNWRSSEAKADKYYNGRLGYYEGTPVIEIPQQIRKSGSTIEHLIARDQILVLPVNMDRFIKFVNVGDPQITEVTEAGTHMDDTIYYEYQQSFGVGVTVGKYFGNVKITG